MPDSKITALASIGTGTDPAGDPLVIVDVSDTTMAASGTTKKVTLNNLLASSPTATLASATITGDLTVDTNTLKVDSANNRVGVGTASPIAAIDVSLAEISSAAGTSVIINNTTGGGNRISALRFKNLSNQWNIRAFGSSTDDLRIGSGATGSEVDFLSLSNTGNLGLGVTPSAWRSGARAFQSGANKFVSLHEQASGGVNLCFAAYESASNAFSYTTGDAASRYVLINGQHQWFNAPSGTAGNAITFTQAMTLDASGNLLVGTTTAGIGGIANTRFTVKGNSDTYFSLIASGGEEMIAACQAGVVKIGSYNNNRFELLQNNNTKVTIDTSGNFIPLLTATAPALGTNSQMVFNLTSNTNLRISVRGTDGTTRTANITLA